LNFGISITLTVSGITVPTVMSPWNVTLGADCSVIQVCTSGSITTFEPAGTWDTIQARAKLPSIGQDIDTAMDLIEKENPVIRGVLPRNYGREGLDKGRLGQLVDLIGSIGFTDIARLVERALEEDVSPAPSSISEVLDIDRLTRERVDALMQAA